MLTAANQARAEPTSVAEPTHHAPSTLRPPSTKLAAGPAAAISPSVRGRDASSSSSVTPPRSHSVMPRTPTPYRLAVRAWASSWASKVARKATAAAAGPTAVPRGREGGGQLGGQQGSQEDGGGRDAGEPVHRAGETGPGRREDADGQGLSEQGEQEQRRPVGRHGDATPPAEAQTVPAAPTPRILVAGGARRLGHRRGAGDRHRCHSLIREGAGPG